MLPPPLPPSHTTPTTPPPHTLPILRAHAAFHTAAAPATVTLTHQPAIAPSVPFSRAACLRGCVRFGCTRAVFLHFFSLALRVRRVHAGTFDNGLRTPAYPHRLLAVLHRFPDDDMLLPTGCRFVMGGPLDCVVSLRADRCMPGGRRASTPLPLRGGRNGGRAPRGTFSTATGTCLTTHAAARPARGRAAFHPVSSGFHCNMALADLSHLRTARSSVGRAISHGTYAFPRGSNLTYTEHGVALLPRQTAHHSAAVRFHTPRGTSISPQATATCLPPPPVQLYYMHTAPPVPGDIPLAGL